MVVIVWEVCVTIRQTLYESGHPTKCPPSLIQAKGLCYKDVSICSEVFRICTAFFVFIDNKKTHKNYISTQNRDDSSEHTLYNRCQSQRYLQIYYKGQKKKK